MAQGSFRKDLESMVWNGKHRDYKTVIKGKKYVMIFRKGIGSSLEPITSISDDDLITLLPGEATRADFRKRKS